jgi:hypothetical protein
MNEGHRNLDQPLQELTLRLRSVTPDILQNLMRFKELGGVEEGDAVKIDALKSLMNTGIEQRSRLDAFHD